MITAEEARKISESYDDGILEILENRIKEEAKRGERSVSVDSVNTVFGSIIGIFLVVSITMLIAAPWGEENDVVKKIHYSLSVYSNYCCYILSISSFKRRRHFYLGRK